MSPPNTPSAPQGPADFDVSDAATLLVNTVRQHSNLQRGPRTLKDAWERTSRALQTGVDKSLSTLFARCGFATWCILFIVQNDTGGQKTYHGKVNCQTLLHKLSTASQEQRAALANAVLSKIDGDLQRKIDDLYATRLKDNTASLQPKTKRQRTIDLDIWSDTHMAETSSTCATIPSPPVLERPELELGSCGDISRYSQAKGTFIVTKDTRRVLSDTSLLEAIVRYPSQTPKGVCKFGVKMFLPDPGTAEDFCIMELEINDELAPDYIRELFDLSLKMDQRGRYFKSSTGSIWRPGHDGILERCKREASLQVLGSMISTSIRQSTLYQEEAEQCLDFTSCVWVKISTNVAVKVKLVLCMATYGGNIIYQQLFRTEVEI